MKTALFHHLIVATLVSILALSIHFSSHAQTLSNTATLSALTVNPEGIIGFEPDRTDYAVGLAHAVTTATISATPTDSGAAVSFSGQDADTKTEGHQVNLSIGLNTLNITVTAEDKISTTEYTLHIGRGSNELNGWKAQDDLDGLIAAGNDSPWGIWGNSSTVWVVDNVDNTVYAYNRDGTADTAQEFQLQSGNSHPTGI